MNVSASPGRPSPAGSPRTPVEPAVKAAAAWVAQFARTLKTCRLYDATNPTVVRFREELAAAAMNTVGEHGPMALRFESDDVTCNGVSIYPARSRDDNLAYPFHRDGVRVITLQAGIEADEIDALVGCVLSVTGANLDGDDLVTLLWEANLRHVDVDYIPAEGDVGEGVSSAPADPAATPMPWPEPTPADEPSPAEEQAKGVSLPAGRSEDWTLGDLTVEVEASFVELDALASVETQRFRNEFTEEHLVPPISAALAIATACLNANAIDSDREEMARFMPRILRTAVATGAWADAREALRALRTFGAAQWSEETFVQELLQPVSVTRVVEKLDQQSDEELAGFLQLAQEVGDPGIDWITLALCESQRRTTRQVFAEALAQRCRDNPERLAPWLNDGRWYVVRNIVHILGWIGGPSTIGMLQVALRHTDQRVRAQVVAALAQIDPRQARPLLIRALDGADTRVFCQVLGQLSAARDPATARYVFAFLQQERFPERPADERRAIYAALASVGGNEIVPELEVELLRGNWFDRAQEVHRHNVARCLARIGTPQAVEALKRAAASKRAPVRAAAAAALGSLGAAA
jgi:HEAT repeat protein